MKTDSALWQVINAYDIDAADVALPFSRRLARDNGWSAEFTRRAIDEYKRFIYLACVSGRTVTPSEEVDCVWHQHLIYTRDYWDRFCGEILRRPIHHCPTQGGQVEADKYRDCYRQTLALYETEFGAVPPRDLWPEEAVRFARPTTRQVDMRTHLVVAKRQIFLAGAAGLALTVAACSPEALVKDAVPLAFAGVIAIFAIICIANAVSSVKPSRKKDDGSGSGCGSGFFGWGGDSGGDSSNSGGGDGGSGCGGGCGGD